MSLNHTRYNSHEESIRKKNQNESKIHHIEKEEITNYDFKQEINMDPLFISVDQNNFFNSLLVKYREEIKFLKDYINRLHKEFRKNLNLEIPFLEEFDKINYLKNKNTTSVNITTKKANLSEIIETEEEIKINQNINPNFPVNENKESFISYLNNEEKKLIEKKNHLVSNNINNIKNKYKLQKEDLALNIEFLKNYLDEASTSLINIDYINPILIIYDKNIKCLGDEIENLKKINKCYEKKIIEFTQENKTLRETLLVKAQELKDLTNIKLQSCINTGIVYDEEYFKNLDERNNSLSKENEIILLNYQKVYNEYIHFQTDYLEKHNENMKKIEIFDKVYEQLNQAKVNIDNLILTNQICENKISELVEKNIKIEEEIEKYKLEAQQLKNENLNLNESINFYKNLIAKINN